MINLPYSLVIEATDEPDYFSFYSPDLEGFTGSGRSIEECLANALSGMKEHTELMVEHNLPVPSPNPDPVVTIRNEQKGAAA